jgi:hypothetical protein
MKKIYRKITIISLVATACACFALKLILFFYLMEVSPRVPNLATGQVWPLNNHGYIVYITRSQNILQYALFYAFVVLGVAAGILNFHWNAIRNKYDATP